MRVVRAGRRPVATPAEVRPAVVRRPARPPPRGRATARAIPSGPNETNASKGTRTNADAREEDASDVSASDDPSRHPSGSSSSSSSTSSAADGNANASQKPFDWDDVGPGLVPSVATACLGAFLFGYHSAVINAPLGAIADDLGFAEDVAAKGAVVSVLVAGGFLGGLGIGPLADAQGRRAALFATTVPLTIGTLISASADSFGAMTIGRLVVGVGASSQIVPLYLSEVSPPNLRGTVNGVRRVAYVMGCLLAFQAAVPLQKPAEATATRTSAPETKATMMSSTTTSSSPSSIVATSANAVAPETRVAEPTAVTKKTKNPEPSSMPSTGVVKPSSANESSAPNRDASRNRDAVAAFAPTSSAPEKSVSNWSGSASFSNDDSSDSSDTSSRTVAEFLRTFGTEAAERTAMTPATKDPAPTAPPPLASPLEYPSASPPAAAETPAEDAATRKSISVISANASEKTDVPKPSPEKRAETQTTKTASRVETRRDAASPETPPALASSELAEPKPEPKPSAPATNPSNPTNPNARVSSNVVTPERKPEKLPPLETLSTKAEARLETKPVRLAPAESAKKVAKEKESGDAKTKSLSTKKKISDATREAVPDAPAPGWWRPLFYWAAAPALLLAMSTAGGVAVESPVWLLGPEGCAMESRRALAKLLNLRGRAAVRWQESVSGAVGRIAVGKARAGRVVRSGDEGDAEEDAEEEDNAKRSGSAPSGDRTSDDRTSAAAPTTTPAGEPAAQSWSALLEDRNRQPVIIGLGLCFLAAFSGSNTVIYFASSVLQEAGLTDPGLLTTAVGVPNLLGGVVALIATDSYGRRPLLLLSFGGMSVALAALSIASALTPGVATESFCTMPLTGSPEEFSGLPCVACDALAAICDDLPAPETAAAAAARSFEPRRTVALVAIPAYTLLFSLGAGPVPWLLYNEVFPTRIRARATSLCTAINYASNTVVGASFLPLVSGIGLGGTYGLYAASCFAGFLFVDRFVFETKGLRLEDVEGVMAERERKWRDEKGPS